MRRGGKSVARGLPGKKKRDLSFSCFHVSTVAGTPPLSGLQPPAPSVLVRSVPLHLHPHDTERGEAGAGEGGCDKKQECPQAPQDVRRRSVKGSGRVRLGLCLNRFAQVQGRVAHGARWAAGVGVGRPGIEPPSAAVRVGEPCHPSVGTRHVRKPHRSVHSQQLDGVHVCVCGCGVVGSGGWGGVGG
eukprot:scaffold1798_cov118-Isochrysis_galbana.AAC.6